MYFSIFLETITQTKSLYNIKNSKVDFAFDFILLFAHNMYVDRDIGIRIIP